MKTTRKPGRSCYANVTGSRIAGPGDPTRISSGRREARRPATRQGVVVKALEDAVVTDDGNNVMIGIKRVEGEATTLVLPTSVIPGLVSLLGQSLATAQRRQDPSTGRQLMGASAFRIQPIGPDGRLMAVIRISGGAELSFLLPATARHEADRGLATPPRRATSARTSLRRNYPESCATEA